MKWFGESWGAAICDPREHLPTPVGQACLYCEERIVLGDQGVVMPLVMGPVHGGAADARSAPEHLDCMLRLAIGSVSHQRRECACYGGAEADDPPQMTKRQAAEAAVRYWEERLMRGQS